MKSETQMSRCPEQQVRKVSNAFEGKGIYMELKQERKESNALQLKEEDTLKNRIGKRGTQCMLIYNIQTRTLATRHDPYDLHEQKYGVQGSKTRSLAKPTV